MVGLGSETNWTMMDCDRPWSTTVKLLNRSMTVHCQPKFELKLTMVKHGQSLNLSV